MIELARFAALIVTFLVAFLALQMLMLSLFVESQRGVLYSMFVLGGCYWVIMSLITME